MSQQIVSDGAGGGADLAQEAVDVQGQTSFFSQLDSKHWLPSEYSFDKRTLDMKKLTLKSSSVTTEDVQQAKSSGGCCIKDCGNLLSNTYYRKYRICEEHAKSPAVTVVGVPARFCQKCSRFQELGLFDGNRRSCRASLEAHNKRRRAKLLNKDSTWRVSNKKEALSPNPSPTRSKATREASQRRPKGRKDSEMLWYETDDVNSADGAKWREYISGDNGAEMPLGTADMGLDIFLDDENNPEDLHPAYKTEFLEQTLSFKLHDATPEDLPLSLLSDIQLQLPSVDAEMTWCEGAVRPGCSHVSLRMRVKEGKDADRLRKMHVEQLTAGLAKTWSGLKCLSKGMEVQMGSSVTHLGSSGSMFTLSALPELSGSPSLQVVRSGPRAELEVAIEDVDLDNKTFAVFCRQNGTYLTTSVAYDVQHDGDGINVCGDGEDNSDGDVEGDDGVWDAQEDDDASICSTESDRSVSGANSVRSEPSMMSQFSAFRGESRRLVRVLGLAPGSCELELMVDGVLTPPIAVLVLPSDECVSEARIMLKGLPKGQVTDFIRDAGLVLRHVCTPETLLPSDLPMIRGLAVKTCEWAMERRSLELLRILQTALPPENACCGGSDPTVDEIEDAMPLDSKPAALNKLEELNMAYPTGKLYESYQSYEMEMERAIVKALCDGVSRLGVEEKKTLQEGQSWKNVACQVAAGICLVVLASTTSI